MVSRRSVVVVLIGLLMCVVSAGTLLANTEPPDEANEVVLASALLEYGKENRDPLALLNAVQILRGLSAQVHERGGPGDDTAVLNLGEILQLAREFAGTDEHLMALVDAEIEQGTKGVWSTVCVWKWAWACDLFGCQWVYQWVCI